MTELYEEEKIIIKAKIQRLRWLGQAFILPEDRVTKIVIERGTDTKREKARRRRGWFTVLEKN